MAGEQIEELQDESYSSEDFIGLTYKVLLNTDYYSKQGTTWSNRRK